MKKYPIHENLNTSFVNLAALVGYLRGLQFVGSVRVELSSYEADITFTRSNSLHARDFDHITGEISVGEYALQRILRRAQEPGGRIHVYQASVEDAKKLRDKIFVDKTILSNARRTVSGRSDKPAKYLSNGNPRVWLPFAIQNGPTPLPNLSDRTALRERSIEPQMSSEEWEVFLKLMAELLRTIDETLAGVHIHFADAFRNACAFVSDEHSFLDPDSGKFAYGNGEISACQQVSPEIFATAVIQALRRVFDRLRENYRFSKILHLTMLRIRVVAQRRKIHYDHYSITQPLQTIIGV